MRSKEFINETPLPKEPDPEKTWTHTGVWNHEYSAPGELRGDDYDNDEYNDYRPGEERDNLLQQKNAQFLGSGAEAVVIKYDADHEVVKILGTNAKLGKCAHLQYLLACKKYANQNPYLPRVESINTVNYDGTRLLYTITMESLEELGSGYPEDFEAMLTKMFGTSYSLNETPTFMTVTRSIKEVVIHGLTTGVNPLLIKAGQLIRAVASRVDPKGGIKEISDLHSGNMMIRRTSTGPQLVITDPLYSGPTGEREPNES